MNGTADKNIDAALGRLSAAMEGQEKKVVMSFRAFASFALKNPKIAFRNIFQTVDDAVQKYVKPCEDDYPNDPESINFIRYDCSRLLEEADPPFFTDRLFANDFVRYIKQLRGGAQQNRMNIILGPPGCGKSTFLNNFLFKLEEYVNTEEGSCFETLWTIDTAGFRRNNGNNQCDRGHETLLEIPCPNHDHPFLLIPKKYRREFVKNLLEQKKEWQEKILADKEYDWLFNWDACTICKSLFWLLFDKLGAFEAVLENVKASTYRFDRSLGEGISVFNPGDMPTPPTQWIITDKKLQERLDAAFGTSNSVRYIFSKLAKTNNGIYVLMDVKKNNVERFESLHNIISEGLHRVDDVEERISSFFLAVMNPNDYKKTIEEKKEDSIKDRVRLLNISYIKEVPVEVRVYCSIFGEDIKQCFLPRVLENFARVIISTRMEESSPALDEWLNIDKYKKYCDNKGQLLRMELYGGVIPTWLSEEDVRKFKAPLRRKIIQEGYEDREGAFSGRESIYLFHAFYSAYRKDDRFITMADLCRFFKDQFKQNTENKKRIPAGFLDSLLKWYNYGVLKEVKESLYHYNEKRISNDIQNYLFALNLKIGSVSICPFTKEQIEVTEDFLRHIETYVLDIRTDEKAKVAFRTNTQKNYTECLAREIQIGNKNLTETEVYKSLHEKYVLNLKEKVLQPFLKNENFRRAINDYGNEDFKTYDRKIQDDIKFLIKNLSDKYGYTELSAKEVCLYVIDNKVAENFS